MSIPADIQTRRLENVVTRHAYASGLEPTEEELIDIISRYFSLYRRGVPLPMYHETIRDLSLLNPNLFNKTMLHALYNLDVLYDSYYDSTEELFAITTSLNKRLTTLRQRRKRIEEKINQALFLNSDTDGFFYSFSENFVNLDFVDLGFTDALVDIERNGVYLPKLNLSRLKIVPEDLKSSTVDFEVLVNGRVNDSGRIPAREFAGIFDGLSDTYWSRTITTDRESVVSIRLIFNFARRRNISNIFGDLLVVNPTDTIVRVTRRASDQASRELLYNKQASADYDTFSFDFEPSSVSRIELVLVKLRADNVVNSQFEYTFGIRDIVLTGPYYDNKATLVTSPISVPTGNANFFVDAVSLETTQQVNPGSNINYYIAADVDNPTSMQDFSWIPISPSNSGNITESSTAYFDGSSVVTYTLSPSPINANEIQYLGERFNYSGIDLFKVAEYTNEDEEISPYLVDGLSSAKIYRKLTDIYTLYDDIDEWNAIITNSSTVLTSETAKISNGLVTWSSETSPARQNIYLTFNLLSSTNRVVNSIFLKNDTVSQNWNVGVYLNGVQLGLIPAGVSSRQLNWEFKTGKNVVTILIDVPDFSESPGVNGVGNISLFEDNSVNDFGFVYSSYNSYIDSITFKNFETNRINAFTIVKIGEKKFILSEYPISPESIMRYLVKKENNIRSVRLMAEMTRDPDKPLTTPIINGYRLKFRHSTDINVDENVDFEE